MEAGKNNPHSLRPDTNRPVDKSNWSPWVTPVVKIAFTHISQILLIQIFLVRILKCLVLGRQNVFVTILKIRTTKCHCHVELFNNILCYEIIENVYVAIWDYELQNVSISSTMMIHSCPISIRYRWKFWVLQQICIGSLGARRLYVYVFVCVCKYTKVAPMEESGFYFI